MGKARGRRREKGDGKVRIGKGRRRGICLFLNLGLATPLLWLKLGTRARTEAKDNFIRPRLIPIMSQ